MRLDATLCAVSVLLAACISPGDSAPDASPHRSTEVELTVFAAASLGSVMHEVKAEYEAANEGITLLMGFNSSAALRIQIEQGAPADLFLSADAANPQALVDAGMADGAPVSFAGNRLAIVVPSDNPADVETPADLARPGVRVVAAGEEVPISAYAEEAVAKLAGLPGYPADFAERYTANIVSREDSVAAIVAKIELGEGDAGIVYATDAAASSDLRSVVIPDQASVPVMYAGVVVRGASHADEARALLDWLAGPDGQVILAEHGFITAP